MSHHRVLETDFPLNHPYQDNPPSSRGLARSSSRDRQINNGNSSLNSRQVASRKYSGDLVMPSAPALHHAGASDAPEWQYESARYGRMGSMSKIQTSFHSRSGSVSREPRLTGSIPRQTGSSLGRTGSLRKACSDSSELEPDEGEEIEKQPLNPRRNVQHQIVQTQTTPSSTSDYHSDDMQHQRAAPSMANNFHLSPIVAKQEDFSHIQP